MFIFKAFAVGQNFKQRLEVVADSSEDAISKLHHIMWWDCYARHEYILNIVGKSRLS